MTTELAAVPQLPGSLELSGFDREAAQAVASGLRDAKAVNTRRACASSWRRFQAWTDTTGMKKADNPPPGGGGRGHQGLAQAGPGAQAGRRPCHRRPSSDLRGLSPPRRGP